MVEIISKPKVEIITPAGACGCSFAPWINKVWNTVTKYRDNIEIVSLSSDSPRAKELGVGGQNIVVNGRIISMGDLERTLKQIFAHK
ncbi:MAG: hypothetical protein ACFFDT_09315 [Candidatus Hodarchaeota archaeon]